MAPDDTMFLTDDGGHLVRKVTLDGTELGSFAASRTSWGLIYGTLK
jgi:hypothetical protein